jgi:hypothetical protein
MFAKRKEVAAAALGLAVFLGCASPADARPGIWMYLREGSNFPIGLVNLTSHTLRITANATSRWCQQYPIDRTCKAEQSYPFEGQADLSLSPYHSAIWKSRRANIDDGDYGWAGSFSVLPEGMDPKWTAVVKMHTEDAKGLMNDGKGTWVYLGTDFSANAGWSQAWGTMAYGLYVTPMDPSLYVHMESVMTLSGTELAVSMYSPDNHSVTVVFRETFWNADAHKGDEYRGWALNYVSNSSGAVP